MRKDIQGYLILSGILVVLLALKVDYFDKPAIQTQERELCDEPCRGLRYIETGPQITGASFPFYGSRFGISYMDREDALPLIPASVRLNAYECEQPVILQEKVLKVTDAKTGYSWIAFSIPRSPHHALLYRIA